MWHKIVKINVWQARINFEIDSSCKCALQTPLKTLSIPYGVALCFINCIGVLYLCLLYIDFIQSLKIVESAKCSSQNNVYSIAYFGKTLINFKIYGLPFEGLPYGSYGLSIMSMCWKQLGGMNLGKSMIHEKINQYGKITWNMIVMLTKKTSRGGILLLC